MPSARAFNLFAKLSLFFGEIFYKHFQDIDKKSCRYDFTMPSPAISINAVKSISEGLFRCFPGKISPAI